MLYFSNFYADPAGYDNVVSHHVTIPSRISIKIRTSIACSLVTKYCNYYLYWNRFENVMGVRIPNSEAFKLVLSKLSTVQTIFILLTKKKDLKFREGTLRAH